MLPNLIKRSWPYEPGKLAFMGFPGYARSFDLAGWQSGAWPDRDRAKVYGFLFHVLNGWVFSLLYVLIFESLQRATWWIGAVIGLGHALVLLAVVVSLMPGFHPRMASERHGPSANRMLEPPGFLA